MSSNGNSSDNQNNPFYYVSAIETKLHEIVNNIKSKNTVQKLTINRNNKITKIGNIDCNPFICDTTVGLNYFTVDYNVFNEKQLELIKQMKSKHKLKDEKLNIFKLIIYEWDIIKAVEFYKEDSFCTDYFLDSEQKPNDICKCGKQHSYNYVQLFNIDGRRLFAAVICEYLLYLGKYKIKTKKITKKICSHNNRDNNIEN